MKRINKKGFTLVELLAVIVIMGILMMVAIPSISRVIENSRKDTFVDIAKSYANAAKTLWTADTLTCEGTVASAVDDGDYYILINTKESARTVLPVLVDQGGKSSWGNRDVNGYVRVHVETVTDNNGEPKRTTTFYVSLSDGTHGLIDNGSMTSDNLKKGNVKMSLSSDDKKKVELTLDNGNLNCSKTNLGTYMCTEVTLVKAITGICVDDSSYAGNNGTVDVNPVSFANDDWATIAAAAKSGNYSGKYNVGDTKVVSGHGKDDSANFTSTDKLYLLEPKEVYGNNGGTAYRATRQLDYYLAQGVTTSNKSGAIKQRNGSNYYWFLRTADSHIDSLFCNVFGDGSWGNNYASLTTGVSPAFRIA